jgi:uncharacterized protein
MDILNESFLSPAFDPRLVWLNAPPDWSIGPEGLRVRTAARTDFWQRTHYGFQVDNGHVLALSVAGDFVMETAVRGSPLHQYDQAGLVVRLSPTAWIKTSVEFETAEHSRLGAVVTNAGWSDWSTQDVPTRPGGLTGFRIRRRGADYIVEAAPEGEDRWVQLRIARLHEDDGTGPVLAGLYACSPQEAGFEAQFEHLRISRG